MTDPESQNFTILKINLDTYNKILNIGQGLRTVLLFILTILMEYFHGYNFVSKQKSNAGLYVKPELDVPISLYAW